MTDAQRKSKNYGLTILGGTHGTMYSGHKEWTYNKPTGGSSSPYRAGDFRNYNHKSTSPIKSISWPDKMMVSNTPDSNFTFDVNFSFRGSDESATMLGLDDVLSPSYYFALILTNGSKYYAKTATQNMQYMLSLTTTNRGYGVSVNMGETGFGSDDNVTAILCMADREITSNYDNPTQATFYSLETEFGIDRKEYTITKSYWMDGMKITLTQSVTKNTPNSSAGFIFTIKSLRVKIEPAENWYKRSFNIKAFIRIVNASSSTVTYKSFNNYFVSKDTLPVEFTIDTGSQFTEYKSPYGYGGNFIVGVRIGTNSIDDDEYGQDPNGSLIVAQINNAFGPSSWGGVNINGYYGVTAELG